MADRLVNLYTKVRGDMGFLYGLCIFIISWLVLSMISGFDKDHGLINLILSAEASVSFVFFSIIQRKQDEMLKAQMIAIEHILKKMDERDQKLMEVVEDIQEEVSDEH